MTNVTLNAGAGGAVMATEQNASAPNENYQIVEIASGAGAAFANRLTITAAGAAKIDASGTTIQANAGTNLNTSALALESGGNLAAILARFPATAALADATANPTLSEVSTFPMLFNGTTWDRAPGDKTNGLFVNVKQMPTTTVTGTVIANIGTSGSLALEGGNLSTLLGRFPATAALADATANPTLSALQVYLMGYNGTTWDRVKATSGKLLVTPDSVALPAHQSTNVDQWAGTAVDTNSGTKSAGTLRVVLATDQPQLTNAQPENLTQIASNNVVTSGITAGVLPASLQAATAGGLSRKKIVTQTGTNLTLVKSSAGQLYKVEAYSIDSAPQWIHFYDQNTTANVTMGTTVADYTVMIPANATAANGAGMVSEFVSGLVFTTGICVSVTTGLTDTDNGSLATANKAVVGIGYK